MASADSSVGGVEKCQKFLAHFYGLHLRLLFNSYALQHSLNGFKTGLQISKPALWLCTSSAMGMLDQISREFGPLKQLYFVQDSIHCMTAYAAIFLIKVCKKDMEVCSASTYSYIAACILAKESAFRSRRTFNSNHPLGRAYF